MEAVCSESIDLVLSKESTPMKDEGTTVDTTTIQFHFDTTPVVCFEVTIPPPLRRFTRLCGKTICWRMESVCRENIDLVLSKESTPTKDEGTTVDTTTIQFHFDAPPLSAWTTKFPRPFVDLQVDVER